MTWPDLAVQVVHAVVPFWTDYDKEQLMTQAVLNSLNEADMNGAKSLSLPSPPLSFIRPSTHSAVYRGPSCAVSTVASETLLANHPHTSESPSHWAITEWGREGVMSEA